MLAFLALVELDSLLTDLYVKYLLLSITDLCPRIKIHWLCCHKPREQFVDFSKETFYLTIKPVPLVL